MKKINCKHGLNEREEIEARRLKNKLTEGDKETRKIIRKYMSDWLNSDKNTDFREYLRKNDKIAWSAWIRFCTNNEVSFVSYYFGL